MAASYQIKRNEKMFPPFPHVYIRYVLRDHDWSIHKRNILHNITIKAYTTRITCILFDSKKRIRHYSR